MATTQVNSNSSPCTTAHTSSHTHTPFAESTLPALRLNVAVCVRNENVALRQSIESLPSRKLIKLTGNSANQQRNLHLHLWYSSEAVDEVDEVVGVAAWRQAQNLTVTAKYYIEFSTSTTKPNTAISIAHAMGD
ncbi:unnamed protein product [Ceratitis capitata]|uniref:(Mediterranean fruit fly) hypothetical protein n=1 Tax=Ceratitis capitata TaxID=7213 RepID=A0A811UGZ0_CERCA|nr:unnamed protein product [Ceratitis capitata]